jgi:hypothetical protein
MVWQPVTYYQLPKSKGAGEDEGNKEEAGEQGAQEEEVLIFSLAPCPLHLCLFCPQYLFSQTVF